MKFQLFALALAALSTAQDLEPSSILAGAKELSSEGRRVIVEPLPQLVDRDDDKPKPNVPEGKVVEKRPVSHPGEKCIHWKPQTDKQGDKHHYPIIAPKCSEWTSDDGEGDIVYDTDVMQLVPGCLAWKIGTDGTHIKPYCASTGQGLSDLEPGSLSKRSPTAAASVTGNDAAPKGLLKEVQKSVHILQSQLAQAQHNQHLKHVHHVGATKHAMKSDDPSVLQSLQQTVQSMQTRLATAKYSIHALFSMGGGNAAKQPKKPSGGIDQGALQDLQRSVHTLSSQLAKARHVLHVHTGKKAAAKKMVDAGLDQGRLQDLQRSAHKLQSQLSKARHTLHAHITNRKAEPLEGKEF